MDRAAVLNSSCAKLVFEGTEHTPRACLLAFGRLLRSAENKSLSKTRLAGSVLLV